MSGATGRTRRGGLAALAVAFALVPGTARADGRPIVFAAASLRDCLAEAARLYAGGGGRPPVFSFGASSLLARQIREGAPADLFISADEAKMDWIQDAGEVVPGSRRDLLSNALAAVASAGSDLACGDAPCLARSGLRRLALADPREVPAGIYAKEYLESRACWVALAPRVLPTADVRAALEAVASGEADAAFVYQSDLKAAPGLRVLFLVAPSEGPRISYPAALLRGGACRAGAGRFLAWLESRAGRSVFRRFGFIPLP